MLNRIKAVILILLLFIPLSITAGWQSGATGSFDKIKSGISEIHESIDSTREFISSVNRFISAITAAADAVTSFIGGKTITLLFAVLILSSGYSAIGIPPGKFTFLPALITADALWLLWGSSIRAEMISYSFVILKTNLIILTPFILYFIIAEFYPPLFQKFRSRLLNNKDESITPAEAGHLLSMLDLRSIELIKKISADIEKGRERGRVILSADTRNSLRQMKELTEKFTE